MTWPMRKLTVMPVRYSGRNQRGNKRERMIAATSAARIANQPSRGSNPRRNVSQENTAAITARTAVNFCHSRGFSLSLSCMLVGQRFKGARQSFVRLRGTFHQEIPDDEVVHFRVDK